MGKNIPLVSVVIRTHNRADRLRSALRCLMDQTWPNLEIFVLDHDSSDETAEIAASYGDTITYYLHRGSFRDTFNVWRDKVRGDFISVLDDDDYIKPDCIAKLMQTLLSRPEIDVAFPRYRFYFEEQDRCIIEKETVTVDTAKMNKLILFENVIPWNAVVFRRRCLDGLPMLEDPIVGGFDYYFWMNMILAGFRFYQHDEVLGIIQRSRDSVQFQAERMLTGVLQCVEYYGRHLTFIEKLSLDYYPRYGFRLMSCGILCMENSRISYGRYLLWKGILYYSFGISKRETLIPAFLIWFAALVSHPAKARLRIEKLFGTYLFRTYHQMRSQLQQPFQTTLLAPIISKIISNLYRKEKVSISLLKELKKNKMMKP